jgi:hypothetical protein
MLVLAAAYTEMKGYWGACPITGRVPGLGTQPIRVLQYVQIGLALMVNYP